MKFVVPAREEQAFICCTTLFSVRAVLVSEKAPNTSITVCVAATTNLKAISGLQLSFLASPWVQSHSRLGLLLQSSQMLCQ